MDTLLQYFSGMFGLGLATGLVLGEDCRHRRTADAGRCLPDLLGTQGHRLDAGAYRPEPRWSLGADPADC